MTRLWGWAAILFFGLGLLVSARSCWTQAEQLRINAAGIRSARWSDKTIPWSEIASISEWRNGSARLIMLHLRDPSRFPGNRLASLAVRAGGALAAGDIAITLSGTDRKFDEAMAAINRFAKPSGRPAMKYDDADWHSGGDFPAGLPAEAGATHIAMFLAWAILNGLAGEDHAVDAPDELERLRQREVTPTQWFLRNCDGKLTDEDLSDEGNAFARNYYAEEDGPGSASGGYLADYAETFAAAPSLYTVEDTWASYDALAPRIAQRFEAWRRH